MFSLRIFLPAAIICILPFMLDSISFLPQPFLIDNYRHYFRNKDINLEQK
jgi:hypothetical protein